MIIYVRDVLVRLAEIETQTPFVFSVCLAVIVVLLIVLALYEIAELFVYHYAPNLVLIWTAGEAVTLLAITVGIAATFGSTLASLVAMITVGAGLFILREVVGSISDLWNLIRRRLRRS